MEDVKIKLSALWVARMLSGFLGDVLGGVDFSEWDLEALSVTEKYTGDASKALQWWTGINKLAKWVKITVTPDRMASFDSAKDEKFNDAVS